MSAATFQKPRSSATVGHGSGTQAGVSRSWTLTNSTPVDPSMKRIHSVATSLASDRDCDVMGVPTKSVSSFGSLSNLGNTCFLNSVIYALRFTPGFSHHLHHLVEELDDCRLGVQYLSRRAERSVIDEENVRMYEAVRQLHALFRNLSTSDTPDSLVLRKSASPIHPSSFLDAVCRVNPLFEGNQQQDAHELLMTILNIIDEVKLQPAAACNQSGSITNYDNDLSGAADSALPSSDSSSYAGGGRRSNVSSSRSSSIIHGVAGHEASENFVKKTFVGRSIMQTRCLECESSTERRELFTNIDLPLHIQPSSTTSTHLNSSPVALASKMNVDYLPSEVDGGGLQSGDCLSSSSGGGGRGVHTPKEDDGNEFFRSQILMTETLRDNNKYWCEECRRLNEAVRSIHFEHLPPVMIVQLKRFTSLYSRSYMSTKVNDHVPTPFVLRCFCTHCHDRARHVFHLFAVIMHLGSSLASGHYISYVRIRSQCGMSSHLADSVPSPAVPGVSSGHCSAENLGECGQPNDARLADLGTGSNGDRSTVDNGLSANGGLPRKLKSKTRTAGVNIMRRIFKTNTPSQLSTATAVDEDVVDSAVDGLSDLSVSGGISSISLEPVHASSHSSLSDVRLSGATVSSRRCSAADCCARLPMPAMSLNSAAKQLMNGTLTRDRHKSELCGASADHADCGHLEAGGSRLARHGQADVDDQWCANHEDDPWLECDDDHIQVVSRRQFEAVLASKSATTTTPYLLMYEKRLTGRPCGQVCR